MRINNRIKSISCDHIAVTSLIKGQIRHEGVPISCEVVVLDRVSKVVHSKVRSKEDGSFVAWGSHKYHNIVMAVDPHNDHNIASQDMVK